MIAYRAQRAAEWQGRDGEVSRWSVIFIIQTDHWKPLQYQCLAKIPPNEAAKKTLEGYWKEGSSKVVC